MHVHHFISHLQSNYAVLTTNEVIAEFTGIKHFPCRHITSLCPDRCNHAQDAAEFKILEWQEYNKPGQYGDDKKDVFRARIDQNAPSEKQDPAVVEIIKTLTPGEKVKIFWEHIYVTDPETNSKWPERPIRSIEKI
jgi:hypothetical protein